MPHYSVIFDHDGTLVNNGLDEGRAVERVIKPYGIDIAAAEFAVRFASISSRKAYATLEQDTGIRLPNNFEQIAEHAILEQAKFQGKNILMPGAKTLLVSLTTQGTPLGVASGSSLSWLDTMLAQTELAPFFGKNVYSALQVKNGKPAPDLLLFAAQGIGVSPDRCIYIGDGIPDIVAAKAAGMTAIGLIAGDHCAFNPTLRDRMTQEGADHIVGSVAELTETIQRLQNPVSRPVLRRTAAKNPTHP